MTVLDLLYSVMRDVPKAVQKIGALEKRIDNLEVTRNNMREDIYNLSSRIEALKGNVRHE